MRGKSIVVALVVCLLAGCSVQRQGASENDPIEGFNRKIFWFNDKVDDYVLVPVASGWDKVAPDVVQKGVSNFFTNLRFPIVTINDLLQGKFVEAASDVGRFGINTTVGVLGFMDPATKWGLEQNVEDFGQTLGVWGVPSGPYLVLPFLGPSNPRDAGGLAADAALSVTPFFVDWYILLGARLVDIVNERSRYLDEVRNAKEQAFDYYSFIRNAYVQRRTALVNDSSTEPVDQQDDLYNVDPSR